MFSEVGIFRTFVTNPFPSTISVENPVFCGIIDNR